MTPPGKSSRGQELGNLLADAAAMPAPEGEATAWTPPAAETNARPRPKYVQIRPDQWTTLDALARHLMDARSATGGRRITANSLIRVAIDALLAQGGVLAGDDEDEIRQQYFKTLGIKHS